MNLAVYPTTRFSQMPNASQPNVNKWIDLDLMHARNVAANTISGSALWQVACDPWLLARRLAGNCYWQGAIFVNRLEECDRDCTISHVHVQYGEYRWSHGRRGLIADTDDISSRNMAKKRCQYTLHIHCILALVAENTDTGKEDSQEGQPGVGRSVGTERPKRKIRPEFTQKPCLRQCMKRLQFK